MKLFADLASFLQRLGYSFVRLDLLVWAVTHSFMVSVYRDDN